MLFDSKTYSVLVVSASEKMNEALRSALTEEGCSPIVFFSGVAAARRHCLEHKVDMVIVNSPLVNDMGTKFALDISGEKQDTVCMIMLKADTYDSLQMRMEEGGVFCVSKPISMTELKKNIHWLKTARERLRRTEQKTATLESKMDEIRIINRAKWILIEECGMTEPDAHRYIEKEAMNQGLPKRQIADEIIGRRNLPGRPLR